MALGEEVTRAVLEDFRTAPVSEQLRATLGFIEKLTREPDAVHAADADLVRATGVRDEAIVDAIHVCTIFNVIDRIADALDFQIPPESDFYKVAPFMLKFGYKI